MYVLGLISIYNMKNSKCAKDNSKNNSKCAKKNELQNFFKRNKHSESVRVCDPDFCSGQKDRKIERQDLDLVQMQKNTFVDSSTCSIDTECLKCKLKNKNIVHLLNIYINSIKQLIIF